MSFNCYLAGYIAGSKIKECMNWRIQIRNYYLSKGWNINFLDPLNSKEFESITPDGLKSNVPSKALVARDWASVEKADLIIANMNTFGESRPPYGTVCEVAWAYTMKKPIVMITTENVFLEHPFFKEFVSWYVPSVDNLLEQRVINYYYKGKVCADY